MTGPFRAAGEPPPASRDAILYEIAVAWIKARDEDLLAQDGGGGTGEAECRVAVFLSRRGKQRTGLPAG